MSIWFQPIPPSLQALARRCKADGRLWRLVVTDNGQAKFYLAGLFMREKNGNFRRFLGGR